MEKIPGYLQDRWNRNMQKIRKVQMTESGLTDLTNFIEDEMGLVKDPIFSREAVGQSEEKPLKQQSRSTKQKFKTHVIKETGDSGKRDKAKCPVFDDIEDIMILKNVKYFSVKPWKTEARHYISRCYDMGALVIYPKSTMQKVVPIEGCAKFAVKDTCQYCMV